MIDLLLILRSRAMSTEDDYDLSSIQSILGLPSTSAKKESQTRSPQPSHRPSSPQDVDDFVPEEHNNLMAFLKTRRESAASSYRISESPEPAVVVTVLPEDTGKLFGSAPTVKASSPSSIAHTIAHSGSTVKDDAGGHDNTNSDESSDSSRTRDDDDDDDDDGDEGGDDGDDDGEKTGISGLKLYESVTEAPIPETEVGKDNTEGAHQNEKHLQIDLKSAAAAVIAAGFEDEEEGGETSEPDDDQIGAGGGRKAEVLKDRRGAEENTENDDEGDRGAAAKAKLEGEKDNDDGDEDDADVRDKTVRQKHLARLIAQDSEDHDDDDEGKQTIGNDGGGGDSSSSSRLHERSNHRNDADKRQQQGNHYASRSKSRSRNDIWSSSSVDQHATSPNKASMEAESANASETSTQQQQQQQHRHHHEQQQENEFEAPFPPSSSPPPSSLYGAFQTPPSSSGATSTTRRTRNLLSPLEAPSAVSVPCLVADCPLSGRLLFRCKLDLLATANQGDDHRHHHHRHHRETSTGHHADGGGSGSSSSRGLLRVTQDPPPSPLPKKADTKGKQSGGSGVKKTKPKPPPYVNGVLLSSSQAAAKHGHALCFGEVLVHRFVRSRLRALQRGGGGGSCSSGSTEGGARRRRSTEWTGSSGSLFPLSSVRGASLRCYSIQCESESEAFGPRLGGGAAVFGRHLFGVGCYAFAACVALGTVGNEDEEEPGQEEESLAAGSLLFTFAALALLGNGVCLPLLWHRRDKAAVEALKEAALHSFGGLDGILDNDGNHDHAQNHGGGGAIGAGGARGGGAGGAPHPGVAPLPFASGLTLVRPLPTVLPWFEVYARRFEVLHAHGLCSALLACSSLLVCVVACATESPGPGLVALIGLGVTATHTLESLRKGHLHLSSLGLSDDEDDGGGWRCCLSLQPFLRPATTVVQFMKEVARVRNPTFVYADSSTKKKMPAPQHGCLEGGGACWSCLAPSSTGPGAMREQAVTKFRVLTVELDQPDQRITCLLDGHGAAAMAAAAGSDEDTEEDDEEEKHGFKDGRNDGAQDLVSLLLARKL